MNLYCKRVFLFNLIFALCLLLMPVLAGGANLVKTWDFKKGLQGWTTNTYVKTVRTTREGLELEVKAPDPFLVSPVPSVWLGQRELHLGSGLSRGFQRSRCAAKSPGTIINFMIGRAHV